jgi:hypothetical protein
MRGRSGRRSQLPRCLPSEVRRRIASLANGATIRVAVDSGNLETRRVRQKARTPEPARLSPRVYDPSVVHSGTRQPKRHARTVLPLPRTRDTSFDETTCGRRLLRVHLPGLLRVSVRAASPAAGRVCSQPARDGVVRRRGPPERPGDVHGVLRRTARTSARDSVMHAWRAGARDGSARAGAAISNRAAPETQVPALHSVAGRSPRSSDRQPASLREGSASRSPPPTVGW